MKTIEELSKSRMSAYRRYDIQEQGRVVTIEYRPQTPNNSHEYRIYEGGIVLSFKRKYMMIDYLIDEWL